MTIKLKITFYDRREGHIKERVVQGLEVPYEKLTLGDLTDKIRETEEYLSRVTGLAVKIETAE